MANSDKNILITPSVGLSTNPTIKFNGANNTPTTLRVLDDGTVSFEATAGQLFSISDGLTGSIFSVNDISGIPSIEVLDTGLVKLNQYGGSTVFGASAAIQNASSVNAKVSISTASATTPGLIIKAVSSQTANLQEWQDSNGTTKAYMSPTFAGVFQQVGIVGLISGARLGVINGGATENAIVARGAASQTADLQQWQNSAGTILARVLYNGNIETPIVNAGSLYAASGDLSVAYGGYFGGGVSGNYIGAAVSVIPWTTTTIGLIVRGRASQTADLQQWQDSSGTALLRVNSAGQIQAPQPASKGLVVKAATTLTATITNAVGSGTTVTYTAANTFTAGQKVTITGIDPVAYNLTSVTIATASATYFTVTNAATGTYVSGGTATVSQSANLQEWQNSSDLTVASMDVSGKLIVPTLRGPAGNVITLGTDGQPYSLSISNTQFDSYGPVPWRPYNTSMVGFIIKGLASQTADLQQWQNSAGTVNARIDAYGTFQNGTASGYGAWINVQPGLASDKGIIIRGAASQTANLQEWQNSSGTVLAKVDQFGAFTVNINSASSVPLTLKAASSQSANIQEWKNSANVVKLAVDSNGFIRFDDQTSAPIIKWGNATVWESVGGTASMRINPYGAGYIGLIVKGFAAQTADLQQWQNSSGTVLAKVASDGQLSVGNGTSNYLSTYDAYGNITSRTAGTNYGANISVLTGATSYIGMVIRGLASQTANLQEWQDSAGTVLAKIDASGNFILNGITMSQSASSVTATNLGTTNNRVYFKEENSGGQVRLTKSTASAANNRATDMAQLYLRDGTTAGTLKLVIIAGTSGAETTILDNIPQ